jgi:hypothetical protein
MKKRHVTILGLFLLLGCNQTTETTAISDNTVSQDTIVETVNTTNIETKISKIDFNFLADCDSLEMWLGGIQGVPVSDSTKPFIMAQCFANKHYDLIVYSKKAIDLEDGTDYANGIIKKVNGAEYYAFEIPKKLAEDPENEFDYYDYVYPSKVKIYKLFDDGWYLIKEANVNSFEELGRLKLNSIYKK